MHAQAEPTGSSDVSLYLREIQDELTSYISACLALVSGLTWATLLAQEGFLLSQFMVFFSLFIETAWLFTCGSGSRGFPERSCSWARA